MKAFNEISSRDAFDKLYTNIKSEIEGKPKEYILGIDEDQFKTYLYDKYFLEPLTIDFGNAQREQPVKSKVWREDRLYHEKYQSDAYTFTIRYPFTGTPSLFRWHSSTWVWTSYEIAVDEYRNTVALSFTIYNQSVEDFNRELASAQNSAFANLDNANKDAKDWNNGLKQLIGNYFDNHKSKLLSENDFFKALNIPINKGSKTIFSAPTITKKDIPQPVLNKNQEFSTEPVMSTVMYDDILKIIYEAGKSMERKPSLYIGKDEESLRDQFLFILETRYDAVTATGETFNRSGKTDIILKYAKDASNLFVAECKFWTGAAGFTDTINQLFDRYLTWRDSKVAVMMFVKNNDFTSVLLNIANTSRTHPYFVKDNGKRGESSFSYLFRLPQDSNKQVYLEIMAFHYDKT